MRRFTELYEALDASNSTQAKVSALVAYFQASPAEDAAWAVAVLMGRRIVRSINTRQMKAWAAAASDLPTWLIDECHGVVGDLAETIALVLPEPTAAEPIRLHELITDVLRPLAGQDDATRRATVEAVWQRLDRRERFVFHKLMSGALRVGVSKKLVIRALAQVVGIEDAVMAHRLTGRWEPTAAWYRTLLDARSHDTRASQPYPFFLASPLEAAADTLGPVHDWQIEWKWDGIRAQLIRRGGATCLWTRGEDLVTDAYPEVAAAAAELPDGTVLDGELLAWESGRPMPFAMLQRRLGRKQVQATLFPEVPVVFMAYDLLEHGGNDIRARPLVERRAMLEDVVAVVEGLELSTVLEPGSWAEAAQLVAGAREHGVEGLMLKRRSSPYGVDRKRGDWWKWKADPYTLDLVLVQAEQGHGRRAGLHTSYTFAVRDGQTLVPITKAYSGLTHEEIEAVDRFVRQNTVKKHGPVRVVEPTLVFEIAFEGIAASPRHRSGIALRFPRMARWRKDKSASEADTLEAARRLLAQVERQR